MDDATQRRGSTQYSRTPVLLGSNLRNRRRQPSTSVPSPTSNAIAPTPRNIPSITLPSCPLANHLRSRRALGRHFQPAPRRVREREVLHHQISLRPLNLLIPWVHSPVPLR